MIVFFKQKEKGKCKMTIKAILESLETVHTHTHTHTQMFLEEI